MRYLAVVFTLCFLLSAVVQYNDPDPAIWMAMYLAGAVVSILFLKKKLPAIVYLVLGVFYLGLAIYQWPPEFEGFLFGEVKMMRSLNIELARESFGLGIVAIAMLLYWLNSRRS